MGDVGETAALRTTPPHADEGEGVGAAPQASYGEGGDAVPPNGVAPNAVYGERGGGGAARHELFAEGEGGEPATNRDRQHSMRSRRSILSRGLLRTGRRALVAAVNEPLIICAKTCVERELLPTSWTAPCLAEDLVVVNFLLRLLLYGAAAGRFP